MHRSQLLPGFLVLVTDKIRNIWRPSQKKTSRQAMSRKSQLVHFYHQYITSFFTWSMKTSQQVAGAWLLRRNALISVSVDLHGMLHQSTPPGVKNRLSTVQSQSLLATHSHRHSFEKVTWRCVSSSSSSPIGVWPRPPRNGMISFFPVTFCLHHHLCRSQIHEIRPPCLPTPSPSTPNPSMGGSNQCVSPQCRNLPSLCVAVYACVRCLCVFMKGNGDSQARDKLITLGFKIHALFGLTDHP